MTSISHRPSSSQKRRHHRSQKNLLLLLLLCGFVALVFVVGPMYLLRASSDGGDDDKNDDYTVPKPRYAMTEDENANNQCAPINKHRTSLVPTNDDMSEIQTKTETMLSFGTRVAASNSRGYQKTQEMIVQHFECLTSSTWLLEHDTFTEQNTVLGPKTFTNYFATTTFGNASCGRVVLAAHYDSKLYDKINFLGAIDSAVPVVMLLRLATQITEWWESVKESDSSNINEQFFPQITLVFFDGEEAFKEWTATDSIYGARHLAQVWEDQGILEKIKTFVLLDLIGTAKPRFIPYDGTSLFWYNKFVSAESAIKLQLHYPKWTYFVPSKSVYTGARVEDDHVPFVKRRVKVVHVIPTPFPSVWHTEKDDLAAISWRTTQDMHKIVSKFVEDVFMGGGDEKATKICR
eukprot:PhM_4_TR16034/c0_g1_i1/m.103315/K00683/QPCT; glutaminyl-peptide cyclotransferase